MSAAAPGGFGFDDDAQALKEAAARLLAERAPIERVHGMVAGEERPRRPAWDPGLWVELGEQGWLAAAVPERAEGLGLPWVAVVGLLEEAGRHALPGPLLASVTASRVLAACETPDADAVAARIAAGEAATVAVCDVRGGWEHGSVGVHEGMLRGTCGYVQEAGRVDLFVVVGGEGIHVVEADAVEVVPDRLVDLTRDQGTVCFDGVPARQVGAAGAWERALPEVLTALAADLCGAAEWQLQTTAAYARVREQFGRPLGFFQAVKHPLVDMMLGIDRARTLLYDAACAIDHQPERALVAARMAKAAASDAGIACSGRSVQLHGGIGFTWECFVHVYFKRQHHSAALFGDGAYQRARLADVLLGPRRLP